MKIEPHDARILVVDDDPGILRALARILGRRHQVTCVSSGPAALSKPSACARIWPSSTSGCPR